MKPDEFYWEGGLLVLTERHHLRRGRCCGNGCRHCPFGHESVSAERRASLPLPWPYFGPGFDLPEPEASAG